MKDESADFGTQVIEDDGADNTFKQPDTMVGVQLYGYQLEALRWMTLLEQKDTVFRVSACMGVPSDMHLPKYSVFDIVDPREPSLICFQREDAVVERCRAEIGLQSNAGESESNDEALAEEDHTGDIDMEDAHERATKDEEEETVDPFVCGDWREDDREKNEHLLAEFSTRGGIFADEMGLGKTQTMIGLILSRTRKIDEERSSTMAENTSLKQKRGFEHHPTEVYSLERSRKGTQRRAGLREVRGTLVFCPGHLVDQWRSEFRKATVSESVTKSPVVIKRV